MTQPAQPLQAFLSAPHPCSYRNRRIAASLVLDQGAEVDDRLYEALLAHGFRRSGGMVYRPRCPDCSACIAVRLPVSRFRPNRSQRRTRRRNADLEAALRPARFSRDLFELYRRYQQGRHPGGPMAAMAAEEMAAFFIAPRITTGCIELRLEGRLVAAAVLDLLPDALSAVYTVFDPDLPHRSLGTEALLRAIDEARRSGRTWLYLGYWIADCRKMTYKIAFQPLEAHQGDGRWQRLSARKAG